MNYKQKYYNLQFIVYKNFIFYLQICLFASSAGSISKEAHEPSHKCN